MTFAGLSAATLAGIFGLVGLATVGLYILKLRRRPIPVPFSPIWQRVLRDRDASQLFSRLRSLLSLCLQLALLALLVLALGDPRSRASSAEGRSLVVLIDASASMQARDVLPSRLEVARQRVGELVQGLGGADRMLLVQMDARPLPLSTLTSDPAELTAGLARLTATDTRADLRRGLELGTDVLRGTTKPEIVVVSDGALDVSEANQVALSGHVPVRLLPVGRRGRNVAITSFSVRRYPLDASRYEVLLELLNTTDAPADVELTLLGDGHPIEVSRLALHPGERLPRTMTDLGGASRTLEARIRPLGATLDDLPVDDHAYALMPERRHVRVQVVSNGSTYLEAALLLDEYLEVTAVKPAAYTPQAGFDVTIFDGVAPPPPLAGGSLYLNPPGEGAPVKQGPALRDFGFDTWDRKSALVRWMAVESVQVARGHALVPEAADHVVGSSEGRPFLVSGRRGGRPFVALGFDPRDSDLVLRPAWPLFVLNVIHSFVEEDSSYLSSFRTGEPWHVPVPGGAATAGVLGPGGTRWQVPIKEGRAVLFGERAGFYRVTVAGSAPLLVAGNLGDPGESHLAPQTSLTLGGAKAEPVSGLTPGVRREIWGMLVLVAVLLSALEWFAYHRRITV